MGEVYDCIIMHRMYPTNCSSTNTQCKKKRKILHGLKSFLNSSRSHAYNNLARSPLQKKTNLYTLNHLEGKLVKACSNMLKIQGEITGFLSKPWKIIDSLGGNCYWEKCCHSDHNQMPLSLLESENPFNLRLRKRDLRF